jgi:hypothetical protein
MKTKLRKTEMDDRTKELERLQKVRAELESRLAAIEDEQKTVGEDVMVLREKVAIRELEKKMKEKRDVVASLRIEKNELEGKMKGSNRLSLSETIMKAKEETENEKDALETEKEEPSNKILRKDEQIPESDETPEESEKKKRLGIF